MTNGEKDFFSQMSGDTTLEAIPEARKWKQEVLFYLGMANKRYAMYLSSNPIMKGDYHFQFQGCVGALYNYLKPKLEDPKKGKLTKEQLETLKDLDEFRKIDNPDDTKKIKMAFIMSVRIGRGRSVPLPFLKMSYLVGCFDLLVLAVENIGISKVEIDTLPPTKGYMDD